MYGLFGLFSKLQHFHVTFCAACVQGCLCMNRGEAGELFIASLLGKELQPLAELDGKLMFLAFCEVIMDTRGENMR